MGCDDPGCPACKIRAAIEDVFEECADEMLTIDITLRALSDVLGTEVNILSVHMEGEHSVH